MPCQCKTTAAIAGDANTADDGCGCATDVVPSCECASSPVPAAERTGNLERIVMELDKRVRKLEASH